MNTKLNVLLLGSGGREHALAWKMSLSPLLGSLFIAPGNAGTRLVGENVPIQVNDFQGIREFIRNNRIDLLVVGPEEPLVNGLREYLEQEILSGTLQMIGPGQRGAMLEGSKDFAKQFMKRHGIPTAAYATFTRETIDDAFRFLASLKPPYVLKADGLAAGKGVIICKNEEEARLELNNLLISRRFGKASEKVVIEEFLEGIELSVFFLTDGKEYLLLPEAKDYKRVGVGDSGPNTGGMGSISPVSFADRDFMRKVEERIVKPTVAGLKKDGIPYCGFVFAGLMNVGGEPLVIEYNVRMGDPETESVVPRIKTDLLEVFLSLNKGDIGTISFEVENNVAACVMIVSGGYPGDYRKGLDIELPGQLPLNSMLFHAGTTVDQENGRLLTTGGRVIAVTSLGKTQEDSLNKTYGLVSQIRFEGCYFRPDIGFDLKG